jgi:lysophospholipase L1-like esterase
MFTVKQKMQPKRAGTAGPIGWNKPFSFSPFCRYGRVFDDRHFRATGTFCQHKHKIFRWKGVRGSTATILSDSLCKWARQIRFTDVQSIPGLNLTRAIECVKNYTLYVNTYKVIIIGVGTNHIEKTEIPEILDQLEQLLTIVKEKNPTAIIAYSGILYRPRDIPAEMEEIKARKTAQKNNPQKWQPHVPQPSQSNLNLKPIMKPVLDPKQEEKKLSEREIYARLPPLEQKRRKVNKEIRKLCKHNNTHFLESWKCVEKKIRVRNTANAANLKCFADDGLHLSSHGTMVLGNYYQKNAIRLLTLKRPMHPKKRAKPINPKK